MKGATIEPCAVINMTAIATNIIAKGTNQYFFLTFAYAQICLKIKKNFISIDLLDLCLLWKY